MQRIFKVSENDKLVVDINTNRKVNIQIGGEEINFFLGNPNFNDAEMGYMLNFLRHELADSLAHKIHKEIGVLVGYSNRQEEPVSAATPIAINVPVASNLFGEDLSTNVIKRAYSKRKYNYKLFSIQIFDKNWVCVFERTNNFRTKQEGKKYAYDIIDEIGMGMRSRVIIKKI